MSDFLNVAEVAEKLRMSKRFVADELRRKNLRGIRMGGYWRISPADVQVYIDAKANIRPVRKAS